MTQMSIHAQGVGKVPMLYTEGNGPWLVFWKEKLVPGDQGWAELHGHSCDGFGCGTLGGYAIPLVPSLGADVLREIAEERFCARCSHKDLDYGTNPDHRDAYRSWLTERGLEAGDIHRLTQAVYPLDASRLVLEQFGLQETPIPQGADLLVLGWNCD